MSNENNDNETVQRCLGSDSEAFGELISQYRRPLYNAVLHMVGNAEDAEDVCQQTFIKAFQKLNTYDSSRKFFSWIYRVAMNEAINYVNARRDWQSLSESFEIPSPNPEEELAAAERHRLLRRAVLALDPAHRAVVVLRHFAHASYAEAAEVLRIPVKTVKSRLFEARRLLRESLKAVTHVTH